MELLCTNKVEMGRRVGKKDMVFCIINAKNSKPYISSKKEGLSDEIKNMSIPIVLAQMRITDGKLGFPGGKVEDSDKTLIDALTREVKEEINYDLKIGRLKPLATFADEQRHISSFTYEATLEEIKNICKNAYKAVDYSVENSGMLEIHLHKQNLENILGHVWSGTASKELELFIKTLE